MRLIVRLGIAAAAVFGSLRKFIERYRTEGKLCDDRNVRDAAHAQVAILGPGAVVKRPVVIDDPNLGETIAVRHMVHLSLTYDHRLVDGADAGRFLQEVKKRLEAGQFEV